MIIGVPWRQGNEWRQRSWRFVLAHLNASGAPVFTADARGPQFNRAASRNRAVSLAADEDVVILHDADMLCPAGAYQEMATRALETGRLVIGYHQYRALDQHTTQRVLDRQVDPWDAPAAGTTEGWSTGGVLAITPEAWWAAGGMDERFTGWGCEDFAFVHAARLTLGPVERMATPAVHLWHPHGNDTGETGPGNSDLLARYTATTTVEELRAVREDSNGLVRHS